MIIYHNENLTGLNKTGALTSSPLKENKMVYNNQFIVVIKHKGKVLREFSGNVVRLPFGSDYSIMMKNKDSSRKALVEVFVDGKDALDSNSIIVSPEQSVELKGFMEGSIVRNKFRFIEKTNEISKYRGNFIEDGLVEIKYSFEEPQVTWYSLTKDTAPRANCYFSGVSETKFTASSSDQNISCSVGANECGITVPGAETKQDFQTGVIGSTGFKSSIIINLKGETTTTKAKRKRVKKPITVKTKIRCSTCGRRWRSSMKYCGNCSTYLH